MSKSTISMYELFEIIPDAETARIYLEDRLWPEGATCPDCRSRERITTRGGKRLGFYRCVACEIEFTIRTNGIAV